MIAAESIVSPMIDYAARLYRYLLGYNIEAKNISNLEELFRQTREYRDLGKCPFDGISIMSQLLDTNRIRFEIHSGMLRERSQTIVIIDNRPPQSAHIHMTRMIDHPKRLFTFSFDHEYKLKKCEISQNPDLSCIELHLINLLLAAISGWNRLFFRAIMEPDNRPEDIRAFYCLARKLQKYWSGCLDEQTVIKGRYNPITSVLDRGTLLACNHAANLRKKSKARPEYCLAAGYVKTQYDEQISTTGLSEAKNQLEFFEQNTAYRMSRAIFGIPFFVSVAQFFLRGSPYPEDYPLLPQDFLTWFETNYQYKVMLFDETRFRA